jgi:hypothetical protein
MRWELFGLPKEYKSIEVMNKSKTHIHQESTISNPIRMSKSKVLGSDENMIRELFQLLRERKSIEVMNRKKMHCRQELTLLIPT